MEEMELSEVDIANWMAYAHDRSETLYYALTKYQGPSLSAMTMSSVKAAEEALKVHERWKEENDYYIIVLKLASERETRHLVYTRYVIILSIYYQTNRCTNKVPYIHMAQRVRTQKRTSAFA